MQRLRVCATPGCPEFTRARRCEDCAHEYEARRGTRQQRGYDATHDKLRAQWTPIVNTGTVTCSRCHLLIQPGTPWHLDHNATRTGYLGPSHALCDSRAAGIAAHALL